MGDASIKEKRLRGLPNLLTALRILLSLVLLALTPPGAAFYAVYFLCGLTDAADGWLARRLGAQSAFGAQLDSAADVVFVAVTLWKVLPLVPVGWPEGLWIALIALLRLSAALTARLRFGRFGFLHTWGNKLTGFCLFFFPVSLIGGFSRMALRLLCGLATLTALEELAVELTAREWDADRKGLFWRNDPGK